jgi:hypothetical protein
MSALHPKADIRPRDQDVCFGPKDGVIDQRLHGLARSARSMPTENLISIKETEINFRYCLEAAKR